MGRLNIIKVKTEYEENGGSPSNDNLCLMTIANGVSTGPDARKQGKSRVVESGLSLILGWSRALARFGIHQT